jgi:hypothetical protein
VVVVSEAANLASDLLKSRRDQLRTATCAQRSAQYSAQVLGVTLALAPWFTGMLETTIPKTREVRKDSGDSNLNQQ